MANFEKRLIKLEQTKTSYLPMPAYLDVREGETDMEAQTRISKNYPPSQVIVWLSANDLTI